MIMQQHKRSTLRPFLALLLVGAALLVAFVPRVRAQISTASVTGIVSDPSGAAIPQAELALRNVETLMEFRTSTNEAGNYLFVNVPPGRYTLRASKQGFASQELSPFTLEVNQTATFNLPLSVGQVTQTIDVTSAAVRVETSTAELGSVVGSQAILNLPLNGRNYTGLYLMTPGASPVDVSQNGGKMLASYGGANGIVPSVNGQLNRSNLTLMDGSLIVDPQTTRGLFTPILDTLQEFKIDSHNDQAHFGGVMGGVVNIATKSGTNKLHGSAWEFVRNDTFDARNPFLATVSPFRQNQFGFVVGGPVVLPHYNGRNKTFFFFSYEGYRLHKANELLFRTATAKELTGDLSDLGVTIYNPYTTASNGAGGYTRQALTNNNISSFIDPHMLAFAEATFPAPNYAGVGGINAINTSPLRTRNDQLNIRGDQRFGEKDLVFMRWTELFTQDLAPQQLVNLTNNNHRAVWNFSLNWSHMFGPSTVLQVGAAGTGGRGQTWNVFSPSPSNDADFGFVSQFTPYVPGLGRGNIPNVSLAGFLGGGEVTSFPGGAPYFGVRANLTTVHGRHTLNMGGDIYRWFYVNAGPGNTGVSFASTQTDDPATGAGGSSLASFLMGIPDSASLNKFSYKKHGQWTHSYYFQDQWKATNKLTTNVGVRYDLAVLPYPGEAEHGTLYSGDLDLDRGVYILGAVPGFCSALGQAPCIPGTSLPDHVELSPIAPHIQQKDTTDIGGRISLAYRLGDKTSLRAFGGVLRDVFSGIQQYAGNYVGSWPDVGVIAPTTSLNIPTSSALTPTVTAEDPLSFGTGAQYLPALNPFNQQEWYTDPRIKNPYSSQWTFGVQRQVGAQMIVSADYVGSSSTRLPYSPMTNTARTPGPGDPVARRPFPYIAPTFYSKSVGRGNYNAFQFQLRKNYTKGLMYVLSYTWSKSEDFACSGFYGVEGCDIQNPYDMKNDKAVSAYDLPHMFNASWVYDLPFGRERRYQTGNKGLDYALGGWQLSGMLTLTSGTPYTVGTSSDIANTGGSGCCTYGYERLNVVGDWHVNKITPAAAFNTSGFALPALYTWGNEGRNMLRTAAFSNVDLSLGRDLPIPRKESMKLQFRLDAFNALNHPAWGMPDVNYNDTGTFGHIYSTRSTPRQLQLSLKLIF
jgi:hypothetical protein